MNFESRSLNLLREFHAELSEGLNSLAGKTWEGHVDNFKGRSSLYMGHASQGYIVLRSAGGKEESRFLIRPAIELMFKQRAIERRPDLIYRLGRTETLSDKAWIIALGKQANEKNAFDETTFDAQLQRFKDTCVKQYPSGDFREAKLSIEELAKVVDGGEDYYNSHYRTYCKFTHATLRAIIGGLDDVMTDEDNLTMICCLLSAIETVISIGGNCPKVALLKSKRDELLKDRLNDCPPA